MGPFIGGIILIIILAVLLIIFAAPLYTKIGALAEKLLKPFMDHPSTDEKEDVWITVKHNRNGEK